MASSSLRAWESDTYEAFVYITIFLKFDGTAYLGLHMQLHVQTAAAAVALITP